MGPENVTLYLSRKMLQKRGAQPSFSEAGGLIAGFTIT